MGAGLGKRRGALGCGVRNVHKVRCARELAKRNGSVPSGATGTSHDVRGLGRAGQGETLCGRGRVVPTGADVGVQGSPHARGCVLDRVCARVRFRTFSTQNFAFSSRIPASTNNSRFTCFLINIYELS